MKPTDTQIGGNHYKTAIQPVEYIHANNLNFFEGNVIKYITRHREKGGKSDLQKAIHYIEMLIQFEYSDSAEITEKVNSVEALKDSNISEIKDGEGFTITLVDPLIADGLTTDNNKNTHVYDSHITAKGKVWPDNPVAYITEPEPGPFSCKGCIFVKEDYHCSVSHSDLTLYCTRNDIIYKSLKQK